MVSNKEVGISPKTPTDYVGAQFSFPPVYTAMRRPLTTDKRQLFSFWRVGSSPTTGVEGEFWYLALYESNGDATWVMLAGGTPVSGAVLTLSDTVGTLVQPTVGGNIQLNGGSGISVMAGTNELTIANTGAGFNWSTITSADNVKQIEAENGYKTNDNITRCQLILPATASLGASFVVAGYGTAGWSITQAAGQRIFLGIAATTVGIGGSLASTQDHDTVEIICITADTEWQVMSCIGNPTIV